MKKYTPRLPRNKSCKTDGTEFTTRSTMGKPGEV